jgi:hypothetical protein
MFNLESKANSDKYPYKNTNNYFKFFYNLSLFSICLCLSHSFLASFGHQHFLQECFLRASKYCLFVVVFRDSSNLFLFFWSPPFFHFNTEREFCFQEYTSSLIKIRRVIIFSRNSFFFFNFYFCLQLSRRSLFTLKLPRESCVLFFIFIY